MYDYCVVGGGIVGLATALEILRREPGASLVLLEKESALATHQTGHNSGVIHSGIYYRPGSLKAKLCREGAEAIRTFAAEHDVPVRRFGKLIVAATRDDLGRMGQLQNRAKESGIAVERLDASELTAAEPAIRGFGALLIEDVAVTDFAGIALALARAVRERGGVIALDARVVSMGERVDSVVVRTPNEEWQSRRLVACAGLQADRLARLAGLDIDFQIIPFRGEYFRLPAARDQLISRLIYPVPDPAMPFLGIHLTRTVDGGVTVGPNAVLGLAREGYRKGSVNLRDVATYARFGGTWRVARNHARAAVTELRNSLSKRSYLNAVRRYCPQLTVDDLVPQPAGIRAQAVLRDGTLVDDFRFTQTARTLHVGNAPSPAATSSIPIARYIADRLLVESRP